MQQASKETEIIMGEIIAWRAWRVEGDHLHSWAAPYIWRPGTNISSPPEMPSVRYRSYFGCGFYASKNNKTLMPTSGGFGLPPIVVGRVMLWGDVVIHKKGYRAEFARVYSLEDGASRAIRRRLSRIYGAEEIEPWWRVLWPVTPVGKLQVFARALLFSSLSLAVFAIVLSLWRLKP